MKRVGGKIEYDDDEIKLSMPEEEPGYSDDEEGGGCRDVLVAVGMAGVLLMGLVGGFA